MYWADLIHHFSDCLFRNSLLALCGVTALYKTTEALPHFLSPYLVDILIQVCTLCRLSSLLRTFSLESVQLKWYFLIDRLQVLCSPKAMLLEVRKNKLVTQTTLQWIHSCMTASFHSGWDSFFRQGINL